ncbi:MAG: S-layer homology domain-containing protein [Anaerolineales bacterium]|nr:S-layer homology domain-containing protein [Anaerolineales bacterium]
MNTKKSLSRIITILIVVIFFLSGAVPTLAAPVSAPLYADDPTPPAQTVKLIFIHHSTGENWLADGYGNLGITLEQNNYFVSGTNYGWGPNAIGDRTDIPNWTEWFRSGDTETYMNALFNESGQNSSYTRNLTDPGGENEIIVFKSCFPNSALEGSPTDPPSPDGWLTVGHAKYVYNEILQYFASRPDKLFIVITAPPLQDGTYAENARAFNEWLMNDWLTENGYTLPNVAVFDFYNVLTGPDNHHRYINGAIEHVFTAGMNTSYYPSSPADDHPNAAGSQKATNEFVSLLNIFYNRWRGSISSIFTDVPSTYWAVSYIERLYNAGITSGCSTSPMMYCPLAPVTRAQMAIFILRGMHGSAYIPPTATGTIFGDVPADAFAAAWIEQFANEGITSGCGGGNYCPDANVTRAQMAIFLLKGEHGASYVPPVATGIFTDVPVGSFAADWIEQLANEGITSGCGGGNYCPDSDVTRDQMAVFLVRAFSLP